MIQEALQYVAGLREKALKPQVTRFPGDPPHVRYAATPDGGLRRLDAEPGYRSPQIERLDDLIDMANDHFDADVAAAGRQAIFYNEYGVELVFDTRRGLERASMRFDHSDEAYFFDQQQAAPLIEPRDLRQALRLTLRHALPEQERLALVEQVSSLGFVDTDQAHKNVQRSRESMDASITRAVRQGQELPAELQTFLIRPFANPDVPGRHRMVCLLDPDTATRRWFLKPLECEWRLFWDRAMESVKEQIQATLHERVRLYRGAFVQSTPPANVVTKPHEGDE